jgi:hypothetical protein
LAVSAVLEISQSPRASSNSSPPSFLNGRKQAVRHRHLLPLSIHRSPLATHALSLNEIDDAGPAPLLCLCQLWENGYANWPHFGIELAQQKSTGKR